MNRVDSTTLDKYLSKVPVPAGNKTVDFLAKTEPIYNDLQTPLGLELFEEIDKRRQEYASKVLNGTKPSDEDVIECPHCSKKIDVNKMYYQCWDRLFDRVIKIIKQLQKNYTTINEVVNE